MSDQAVGYAFWHRQVFSDNQNTNNPNVFMFMFGLQSYRFCRSTDYLACFVEAAGTSMGVA
ncbi:hypothetical protein L1F30_09835 [Simiduia sp. 21SJ11W-1]|uniref:hypothetical protein n=1 Tax=Simiduia sp. 21SJ11W-1 TaxID=2909669 RepID=UPI00209FE72D|nr:hypothetical protein [Simiduia sp. 21SJ11W-1]UTA46474.1 hypothetical protein L1F30_09835 [Simiduia sp. 21SJ11W-1]